MPTLNTILGAVTAFMQGLGLTTLITAGVVMTLAIGGMIMFINWMSSR